MHVELRKERGGGGAREKWLVINLAATVARACSHEMSQDEIAQYQLQQNQRNKKSEKIDPEKKLGTYKNIKDVDDEAAALQDYNVDDNAMLENQIIESDYVLLDEPVSLMAATQITIKESTEITNHIVLCGIHPSLYYFILPLRAKYLKEWQYIVILSDQSPNKIWEFIKRFPKIIYIKGSPLISEDLMRANINFADKAVIFSQEITDKFKNQQQDEMLDAESIFIYKAIKKINKNVQIMTELVYPSNIEFLLPKDIQQHSNILPELTPLFSAGEVYISSIIDTLTCQTYYNPHILTILQQILTGGKQSNPVIRAICDEIEIQQSNLWQIPVPEDYYVSQSLSLSSLTITVRAGALPLAD